MSWKIETAKRVRKEIKRIPKKDAMRLFIVFGHLEKNPYYGGIEKIEGEENLWRRRVGNYRIIYEIFAKEKLINVLDLRRRTTATYK